MKITMNTKILKVLFPIFLITLLFQLQIHAQTMGWGRNSEGGLGIGNNTNQLNPVNVTAMSDAIGIGGGLFHTLILKPDGTVMATGLNNNGQLGDGTTTQRTSPVAVPGSTNIRSVSVGGYYSTALRADGTVWSWGRNDLGQMGNGTTGADQLTPTQTTISDVIQVEAGFYHTLALKSDGTVWAWGQNSNGQLGNNTTTISSIPIQIGVGVTGFDNIIAVSAGEIHSMALKSDGTVWVWGRNIEGQVGNGSAGGNQLVPVQNTTLTDIVQISAGALSNLALKPDGTVWVWGYNAFGQVGNGSSGGNQLTPVQNTTAADIIEIEAGNGFSSFVRRKDGAIFSWGYNGNGGGIGDGTTTDRLTPFQVPVGAGNADISAGYYHAFASKPTFSVPVGTSQSFFGHNLFMIFDNITAAGNVSITAIDPTTTGLTTPGGYIIQPLQPAYELTKTATTTGNIFVCLQAPNEIDPVKFARLKILHEEGGALVDRTHTNNYQLKRLCSKVTSFSKFVVAEGLAPTAANVSVSGRVQTGKGRGIPRAIVSITDSSGEVRTARVNQFGYFKFEGIEAGDNYVINASAKGYSFAPQVLNVDDDITKLTITGN